MLTLRLPLFVFSALSLVLILQGCNDSSSNRRSSSTPVATNNELPTTLGCGALDTPETGIQGDIPRADKESGRAELGYNCGLSTVHQLDITGAVQGYDHCAYVRTASDTIQVLDMSDPTRPVTVGTLSPGAASGLNQTSETIRVVTTEENPDAPPLLASGSSIYDISDCDQPVEKGKVAWPGFVPWPAGMSHDIRVGHAGDKVYSSVGVVVADISDLNNPDNWPVVNHTCDLAAQFLSVHLVQQAGVDLCDVMDDTAPQMSHGPDDNATGTRLYVGNQGIPATVGDASGLLDAGGSAEDVGDTTLRIIDLTTTPPTIVAQGDGPGHSIDWFRTADGREYILHANEFVFVQQASCAPHPRPNSLGWAFEAFITEVTGDTLVRRSMLELDINKPENCAAKMESGQGTSIAYHSVDNPFNATFAMVSFGDGVIPAFDGSPSGAGLRLFDIRNPSEPLEVAYFNAGPLEHAGASHYDHKRGLLYMPDMGGVRVLELQPQIIGYLGLPRPSDPAYPRYPNGRPATPTATAP